MVPKLQTKKDFFLVLPFVSFLLMCGCFCFPVMIHQVEQIELSETPNLLTFSEFTSLFTLICLEE